MAIVPVILLVGFSASVPDDQNAPLSTASWVWFWALALSLTVFVIYPAWFIGRRGQTPGMKKMGVRLYRINREGTLSAPSRGNAWGRSAAALVAWLILTIGILVDYLWSLGDKRRQCLHDKIGRTVAVQEGDRRRFDKAFSPPKEPRSHS